jgi:hypothetical protein
MGEPPGHDAKSRRLYVMAALVAAIHVFAVEKKGVDGRDKPGQDG